MGTFSCKSNLVYGTDLPKFVDGFSQNPGFRTMGRAGSSSSPSLVLDNQRGELVKALPTSDHKGVPEAKAMAALKSHREAERRRRERINTHLNTLRNLIPSKDKMDKATLLAEVVSHVKELKRNATEASNGYVIPMDADEVRVEPHEDDSEEGYILIRASLCSEYRPELMSDLRQALDALNLKTVRAEISTLGERVKNVIVMIGCKEENIEDAEVRQLLLSSVHHALMSVLDKVSATSELSSRSTLPNNKRRRVSLFESSSSSS